LLHLVARLVGRHTLHLLNIYPFVTKYILPNQNEVTQILACLVEATHRQVPPDELRPVIMHLMQNFVTEAVAPEVIEVGLNTIREVCTRSVNVLTEDELADLVAFKKFKHKGVMIAARSLINAYREIDPQLLHRSLRGREATMAMTRGELQAPKFGADSTADCIDGLELLAKSRRGEAQPKKKRRVGAPDQSIEATGESEAAYMMSKEVLSSEDFKKMRKLQLQKSVEVQLGRKRNALEMSSSSDDEGSNSDSDSDRDDERGLAGRMPDFMSGQDLKGRMKKGRTKAERKASAESGRTDWTEKLKERHANRKGGKTNKEKNRSKPTMMIKQSKNIRKKANSTSRQKMSNLKKHIKTLKKKTGGKQLRRR